MKKLTVFVLVLVLALSMVIVPSHAAEDVVVDLGAVGGTADYSAHGYGNLKLIKFGYGSKINIGTFDLSQYDRVEITYATDRGFKAFQEGMSHVSVLGIKSAADPIFGYVDTPFNEENSLGWAELTDASDINPSGANWDKTERTVVIDVSGQNYNGPIWLSCFNSTGNETLVVSIKFVAKSANPETADFGFIGMAVVSLYSTVLMKKKKH